MSKFIAAVFTCAFAFALTLMALPSGALALTFTTIDVPGAESTEVYATNTAGQILGTYGDNSNGTSHGFLWRKGTFTTIDVPDAAFTSPLAINAAGQILGTYGDSTYYYIFYGFVAQ